VGIGGSVGSVGGLLVGGVGVAGSDGGASVGGIAVGGGAVGAAVAGADGVGVRAADVAGGGCEVPEAGVDGGVAEPFVGVARGDALLVLGESVGGFGVAASRVTLNPARARPTASDGPRRTYNVKDARPRWPGAPPSLPVIPPTLGRYFLPSCKAG
jgi:hypothetical protein